MSVGLPTLNKQIYYYYYYYYYKVITTAHAHKSGVIFHFFPRAFKQKKLRLYDQR